MSGHHHTHPQAQSHDHATPHDHAQPDWDALADALQRRAEVYGPLYTQVLDDLRKQVPGAPARIVDAGSGPGVLACRLAETFPEAEVIAVDSTESLLERTTARAADAGLAARVRTHLAELPEGLADVGTADVLWLSHTLHHFGDQRAALADAARALAPGGTLVLAEGGLTTRYLPRDIGIGRPGLQARLDVANEEAFIEMRAALPGVKDEPEDWPGLLTSVGLRHTTTRSYLLDLPAPLPPEARAHVTATLTRYREGFGDHIAPDDLTTLDRLLDPADPAGLHRRTDLFLLGAETVHTAVKP
ncbi:class I SAM-dependent methyltransferase [Streptomyces sp. E11-3]|uniref:class I SAM-dependent methyltransferase n=1 Tax=Streptomyces sp. E11-3 TaxID=3110112 RepID=UPI0039802DD6